MDHRTLAIVSLRALGQLYAAQGNPKTAGALQFTANAIEAGQAVDEHMRNVAAALDDNSPTTWDDVHARMDAESQRMRSHGDGE